MEEEKKGSKSVYEQKKELFIELCKVYGYEKLIENHREIYWYFLGPMGSLSHDESIVITLYKADKIELAKLLLFLHDCYGSKITLTGIKIGKKKEHCVSNKWTISNLIKCVNTVLFEAMEEMEEEPRLLMINDSKNPSRSSPKTPWKEIDVTEELKRAKLFTKEELKNIVKQEKNRLNIKKVPDNARIGASLYSYYNAMYDAGYFTGYKFKEYSFLYDYYAIVGEFELDSPGIFTGTIGKYKYNIIRHRITAYETYIKKQKV